MNQRIHALLAMVLFAGVAIILRLFYWQIVRASELEKAALEQRTAENNISPDRGDIVTADGFPLVFNEPRYTLTAYTPNIDRDPQEVVKTIMSNLTFEIEDPEVATDPAKKSIALENLKLETEKSILEKITSRTWAPLANNLSLEQKEAIEKEHIAGLGFDELFVRRYPEASMAAHLLGFVGKDDIGSSVGYFGLEGFYDRELRGVEGLLKQEKDALGNPLLTGSFRELLGKDGRTLKLYIERGIQFIAEQELKKAIERYGARSGEVIIMDPKTGGILALAAEPSYEPEKYRAYETARYKNPAIANTYEPGSTFKVLVMAAALEEKAVKEDDTCDICGGPLEIGKYTIKTWNSEYIADRTLKDIIVYSDNIGMVWTQQKLGGEKLVEYLQAFGLGEKTGIDLQEEVQAPLREKWGQIDYATASFGQGIAVTSIQMVRAVGALANGGKLVEPHVVHVVQGSETLDIQPRMVREVVSESTAKKITSMMVQAVDEGEAQWTRIPGYEIAGKTGTAQIPVAGHYDQDRTIASFVGFAPANDPAFVMLVKLTEPMTSPWGSETAAPLWFGIARKLLVHLNIPPTRAK